MQRGIFHNIKMQIRRTNWISCRSSYVNRIEHTYIHWWEISTTYLRRWIQQACLNILLKTHHYSKVDGPSVANCIHKSFIKNCMDEIYLFTSIYDSTSGNIVAIKAAYNYNFVGCWTRFDWFDWFVIDLPVANHFGNKFWTKATANQ